MKGKSNGGAEGLKSTCEGGVEGQTSLSRAGVIGRRGECIIHSNKVFKLDKTSSDEVLELDRASGDDDGLR